MSYKVSASGVFVNSSGVRLMDRDVPVLRWGDGFSISLVLPAGTVAANDKFALAVDTDRFLGNGLCALSEDAVIDSANNTVSFTGIATNTQKFLNAVNGKPDCMVGQIQLTRYVGGDITNRQTLLDDRCMLRGLVYVNGATVYILDPNASYTKEQVDAIFATAVVFQFSEDGESWHDTQTDNDIYLRFRNPAVETSTWSDSILFMRSDIVPLVTRAENAAIAAEAAKEDAVNAKVAAGDAKNAAAQSATSANNAKDAAALSKQDASNAAETAVSASASAISAKNAALSAKTAAENARDDAHTAKNAAESARDDAVSAKNQAAGSVTTATQQANLSKGYADTSAGIKDDVVNERIAAENASASAYASATASAAAKNDAITAKNAAIGARNEAQTARDEAQAAKVDAVSAKNDAVTAKGDAIAAKADAISAKNDAVSAKNAAAQSKTDAEAAVVAAGNAKDGAIAAKTAAEGETEKAATWSEGDDTSVEALGGTHSSKKWAQEAESIVSNKAARPSSSTAGDVAGLTSGGDLTDTGIPASNVAQKNGYYGADGLGSQTAENLVDTKATGANRQFTFGPSAGDDVSISDNGNAQIREIRGTTNIINQMVAPSKEKTATGTTEVQVTDAVAGNANSLEIVAPKSVVMNQMVHDVSVPKTATGTASVEVSDAVAGDALALRMVAPRSVVVNQLVQNGDFSDGTTRWAQYLATLSAASNVLTATLAIDNSTKMYFNVLQNLAQDIPAGRAVLVRLDIKCPYAGSIRVLFQNGEGGAPTFGNLEGVSYAADTWTTVSIRCRASSMTDVARRLLIYPIYGGYNSWTVGDVAQLRNVQLVDLTQYFNGDSTLIDSITSWDDLVAYDPRFAQYVEYNAGEVAGVQPSVRASGKNLYDKSAWHTAAVFTFNSRLINGFFAKAGVTYTIKIDTANSILRTFIYTGALVNGTSVDISSVSNWTNEYFPTISGWADSGQRTITTTVDCYVFFYRATGTDFTDAADANSRLANVQIELGSTATAYEPYHDGGTAQAPAPLFAVGSAADEHEAVAGVTTHKMASVDLGTLAWQDTWFDREGDGRLYALLTGKATGLTNIISAYGVTVAGDNALRGTVGITGNQGNSYIYVGSGLKYSTAQDFINALNGVYAYYELATPTTSPSTPAAITLQAGANVAMQTDGGRTMAELELGYNGTEETVALDSSHKYAFSKTGEVITGESSQVATCGVDMLVDLMQYFNGDVTLISAITDWASLVAFDGKFSKRVPYNRGTVSGSRPTIEVIHEEYAYGAVHDPSSDSHALQQVEFYNGTIHNVNSFSALQKTPCHDIRRCVMDDLSTRHVNYWLDPVTSSKKADGTPSVLTGADGDVMCDMPLSNWECNPNIGNSGKVQWLISDSPFRNSTIHPSFYVSPNGGVARDQFIGAYRASVCDATGLPLNTTEGATAQSTGTSSTRLARSIAGALPLVNVPLADLRSAANRNGGTMVNSLHHQWLLLLMAIEAGTLNTQSISAGYSNGKANALWAWRKSGRVDYGNGTGQLLATEGSQDDDNFMSFKVGDVTYYRDVQHDADGRYAWSSNHTTTIVYTDTLTASNGTTVYSASTGDTSLGVTSSWSSTAAASRIIQFQYRGIENPFGEVWEFEDGMQKFNNGDSDAGYWWTAATDDYTSTAQQGNANATYWRQPHAWPVSGYVKSFDPRTFLPLAVGGSASTYLCDYFYNDTATGSRVVLRGGSASDGAYAGAGSVSVYNGLAHAYVGIGGRLSA